MNLFLIWENSIDSNLLYIVSSRREAEAISEKIDVVIEERETQIIDIEQLKETEICHHFSLVEGSVFEYAGCHYNMNKVDEFTSPRWSCVMAKDKVSAIERLRKLYNLEVRKDVD